MRDAGSCQGRGHSGPCTASATLQSVYLRGSRLLIPILHSQSQSTLPHHHRHSPCALKPLGAQMQPSISFQGPSGMRMGAAGMSKLPGMASAATRRACRPRWGGAGRGGAGCACCAASSLGMESHLACFSPATSGRRQAQVQSAQVVCRTAAPRTGCWRAARLKPRALLLRSADPAEQRRASCGACPWLISALDCCSTAQPTSVRLPEGQGQWAGGAVGCPRAHAAHGDASEGAQARHIC